MKEKLLHAVIGHKYIGKAISIVVGKGYTQPATLPGRDSRFLADVLERTVAVIAIEKACGRGEFFGWTVGVPFATARLAVPRIPFHVAGNEQVKLSIIVIIEKAR